MVFNSDFKKTKELSTIKIIQIKMIIC